MLLENWTLYTAPPGSRYSLILEPEERGDKFRDVSIIADVLDARPGVQLHDTSRLSDGRVGADVSVLREGSLGSILGQFVHDGSRFYRIVQVTRTDDPTKAPIPGTVTVRAWVEGYLDRQESEQRAVSRALAETGETVADFTKRSAIFSVPLIVAGAGIFLLVRRGL